MFRIWAPGWSFSLLIHTCSLLSLAPLCMAEVSLWCSCHALRFDLMGKAWWFQRNNMWGPNSMNQCWAVWETKSEGLSYSHNERMCVCVSLTLLYSECFVILYRLIHGQSMILISEIFVDTAGPRHQEGVSASGVRISVSTEPASKPWGLHSTVNTLTPFQVDPESGPFLLPSSNPRSHAHQR